MNISSLIPDNSEKGTGLILENRGLYLFQVSGRKHRTESGERFFAGIGGHCEEGEGFIQAAKREAVEETGKAVEIIHSARTDIVQSDGSVVDTIELPSPAPRMIYKMLDRRKNLPEKGPYFIACFNAHFIDDTPFKLDPEEVSALIAISKELLCESLERKIGLEDIISPGGKVVAGSLKAGIMLFPLGTAVALANLLKRGKEPSEVDHDE
ncbi:MULTISPECIES: NUDIX domain-containing protein [unclassified Mesotoga]|uniref:NUDIX domain-containing protein n=1 Tax=unclassified Mesotoga TaxID=1184398 RepID=UPI000DA6B379|nr:MULTISPECIES: NUDIX domain-containing protein [unclassified Mesotoga]PZC51697.1 NUDIX hydrolase [Mesotoga sp. TolDC]